MNFFLEKEILSTMYSFLSCLFLLLLFNDHMNAENHLSPTHQRLASLHCHIDDYSTWLEQKKALNDFLQLSQLLGLNSKRIKEAIKSYRSQQRCINTIKNISTFTKND